MPINDMMLDMLAAIARKDYEDRQRRQQQGIENAKQERRYKGRGIDRDLHHRIIACLTSGMNIRQTAASVGCAVSTVQRVKAVTEEVST